MLTQSVLNRHFLKKNFQSTLYLLLICIHLEANVKLSYKSLSYITKPQNYTPPSFHLLCEALFMKLLTFFQSFSKSTNLLCASKILLVVSYKILSYITKPWSPHSFHTQLDVLFVKLLTLSQIFSRCSDLLCAQNFLLIGNFTTICSILWFIF